MASLDYTSVATVALHVDSLIKRGHLRKRDRAARSLEVVHDGPAAAVSASAKPSSILAAEEKWLVEKIEAAFQVVEQAKELLPAKLDELYVLVGALKVLELDGAAHSFLPRLSQLKKRYTS
jgi:hypothetical protein